MSDLTREQIEDWREWFSVMFQGEIAAEQRAEANRLCDMALRLAAAERERDEARDHARKHVPSIQRIREAHTQMTAKSMEEWSSGPRTPGWGHRVYTQGADEACYLCALIIHAEKAEARVEALEASLRQLAELGEQGMEPNYNEWLTFHDKVAKVARAALGGPQDG